MANKMTISIPDALFEKIQKWRDQLKPSEIFQQAISREIELKERFLEKVQEEKTVQEIWNEGDFTTPEGQEAVGRELGFAYAKKAPYPEIKKFETYRDGWKQQDPKTLAAFHYDLNFWTLLDEFGFVIHDEEEAESLPEGYPLTERLDYGFMAGIMDFINEECSFIEVHKLARERDAKYHLAKTEDDKLRIIAEYQEKFKKLEDENGSESRNKTNN